MDAVAGSHRHAPGLGATKEGRAGRSAGRRAADRRPTYVRVSSKAQDHKSQRTELERVAKAQGHHRALVRGEDERRQHCAPRA